MYKILEPYIDVYLICPLNCVSNKLRHCFSPTSRAPVHRLSIFYNWLHWSGHSLMDQHLNVAFTPTGPLDGHYIAKMVLYQGRNQKTLWHT